MVSCARASHRRREPRWRGHGPLRRAALPLGLSAVLALSCAPPPRPPLVRYEGSLGIEIEAPKPGARLTLRDLEVAVRGRARLPWAQPLEPVEVFVLIEASESTRRPSGWDVDGDGEVGFDPYRVLPGLEPGALRCTDPEDSVLHAELAAAARLLDHVQAGTDRVGLAFFSQDAVPDGRLPAQDGATVALGSAFRAHRAALEWAKTDASPTLTAGEALERARRALRSGRPTARRILLTLRAHATEPSLPSSGDGFETVTLAVHDQGDGAPKLRRPVDVLGWLAPRESGRQATLTIANDSLGPRADDAFLARDGRFSGSIPVGGGSNRVRVAIRGEGASGAARFAIDVEPDLPTYWELLQQLGEIQRRNQELIRLVEDVEERGAGEIEIRVGP